MRKLLIGLFFLLSYSLHGQNKHFKKTPIPNWVDKIEFSDDAFKDKKGISTQYLLISDQTNRLTQESYYEQAYKVVDIEAVQSSSNFNISFDPSYESIHIHKLDIIRNGKKINKLDVRKFEVIRQETDLQNYLYNGRMSAIHQLKDVRKGDIISYAYTRKGFHPFYKQKFGYTFYQNHSTPVATVYTKLIISKDEKVIEKVYNQATPFKKEVKGNLQIFTQRGSGMEDYTYENNETAWFNGFKYVQLSTYQNWNEVVEWALPKYKYNRNEIRKIWEKEKNNLKGTTKQYKILSWIHFIQDEIRYMGIENGINAFQPHSPTQVYNQRYGDCKDKSLLLTALLREEGVEAYPMLVNTRGKLTDQKIPGPNRFNHCIVQLIYKGKEYYIDPTMSNQGGDLRNFATPDYYWGLVIKEGNNALTKLPKSIISKVNIQELIDLDSIGGGADISIRTEYYGPKADDMRAYFSRNDRDFISDQYEKYYANLYDGVTTIKPVKFLDNDKNTTGKIIIEEFYHTDSVWEGTTDSMTILFRVSPFLLYGEVAFDKVHQRKTPYYISEPIDYHQETKVTLPIEWDLGEEENQVKNEFFKYNYAVKSGNKSNQYTVIYDYQQDSNYVNAGIAKKVIKDGENTLDKADYSITYDLNFDPANVDSDSEGTVSYASIFLFLLFSTIFTYFARKIYFNFNPPSLGTSESWEFGGWLILPLLGIMFSPLRVLYDVFTTGYFSPYFWSNIETSDQSIQLFLLVIMEFAINSFTLVLSVFTLILAFNKRTSTKYFYSTLLVTGLIFPLIDNGFYYLIYEEFTDADFKELSSQVIKSLTACAIWVPYIFYSERSKNTFTKTYIPKKGTPVDVKITL
ncbi:DUF3857 domain-containing protein [Flammeovirga yaeyamensis]|uniref:DUF3857 domain-containing protein n=1 Tax=Flammeovirga yaeyamensis TaxID=367791 RepID=A0AAX1N685_9BACT|nr:DUF3857 domain-containing protein [Flammeovirga yaeyamensis]MBB3698258.1 hypothetical protein [Flammeovirga yaeyamensis]NMF34387.1 DUF3857 domain-containing protein [Flammeovirga yaeyamensis]QWG01368.1 DUF3857 domain-containing protein [Flammeovirga yaeyamensis]